MENRIATKDARVIKSLRDAGAIVFSMVNMHEGALGATTNNPHFGRTANPLDFERTPGGSSGGSAAAIAAGLADAALGTDTMGSGKDPCCVLRCRWVKTNTCGLVPRDGLHFLSPSLDTIGPMAPDIDTLGYMIKIMAGTSKSDPLSRTTPLEWMKKPIEANPSGIIIFPTQLNLVACEAAVIDSLAITRIALEKYGAKVVDVDVLGWNPSCARRASL